MKVTGAEALLKSLEQEGVEVIFGYPGGVVLPIYDALYANKKIHHLLVRHEQGAAHAADGYARATGKTGVCLATSGPGATNLVTGIANAYMDSIPMVAITGQVASPVMGTDAFQEVNITGVTLPIVKHSYLVTKAEELPQFVKEAFYIASTGRKGPVLIDIPADVLKQEFDFSYPQSVNLPGYKPTIKGHAKQIKEAVKQIMAAKKPVIVGGGGIIASDSSPLLVQLAEMIQAPVTTTLMGKGAFPPDHQLSLGMPGMHGTRYANYSLTESDLLLAIGMRFDDRVTGKLSKFGPNAKVIHVDTDPAEISKNINAHIPIVGDAGNVMEALIASLKKQEDWKPDHDDWLAQIEEWKRKYPLFHHHKTKGEVRTEIIIEEISRLTKDIDTVLTTGVGQHQMWSCQYFQARSPRSFVSSGGLGTMGFGLPAAIGAQIGRPDSLVINVDGDGSLQMVSQELATAVANKLPIVIALINNGYLGMVRQWQGLFYGGRYSQVELRVGTPDFVKLADAYGMDAIRVTVDHEVKPALEKAISIAKDKKNPRPILIDFWVSREADVFPMVAPGGSIEEMLGGVPGAGLTEVMEED